MYLVLLAYMWVFVGGATFCCSVPCYVWLSSSAILKFLKAQKIGPSLKARVGEDGGGGSVCVCVWGGLP